MNPFTGKMEFFPDDVIPSLDHILPRNAFKDIQGFNQLPKDIQEKIINDPANLQPLPKHLNSSKGAKIKTTTDGWSRYVKEDREISPDCKSYLLRLQRQVVKDATEKVRQELLKLVEKQ